MATTRKLPKVTEYIKNVGKSVAFTAIEGIKENTPGVKDFLETNEDIFKDVYSSVKNYRQTVRTAERSIKQSNLYQAIEYGVKNMIEDAKTGKFYNDRTAEIGESALGMDDFGDDMDISFSDSSDEPDSTMASASMLSDSFSTAIGAAATSQNTMVAKGTGMIIQSTKASTKLMMVHMDKNAAMLSSSIGTVYSGIATTNAFLNGPMKAHLENSKRYYEESLRTMDETRAMLKEMLEMQRNMYKSSSSSRTEKLDEAMGYDGSVNLSGYLKNIKSNAGAIADSLGLSMLKMDIGGGNPYMLYAAAPFKMILEPMMDRMMSKDFKKALASFDKGLTSLFSQFVARMNTAAKKEDGSLMSILGKLFGIELSVKESIDTSNYKKDAVPFDGITRQSIIETIPGYLARIEAALTGAGERHYDFKSGSWKSAKQIEKEFDYKKSSTIRSSNYESIMEMEAELAKMEKTQGAKGKKRADSIRKQANNLYKKLFEEGGDFRPQGFKDEFGDVTPAWEYYGFKSEKDFNTWYKTQSKNTQRGFAASNMRGRNNYARMIREEEEAGGTGRHLFNGAYDMTGAGDGKRHDPSKFLGKASGLLGASADMHGRTVFWYLNEILDKIGNYKRTKKEKKQSKSSARSNARSSHTSSSSSSNSSSDEGDGSDDPDDDGWTDEDEESYSQFLSEEAKKREEEAKKNKKLGLGDWISKKFGDSALGKFFSKAFGGAEKLLSKPMEYMTKMINKADEGMFQMMFGKKEVVDEDGNKITGVFPFMVYKVKETFKKLQEQLKKLFNDLKDKLKPFFDKFKEKVKPVTDEVKNMAKQAWGWAKGSVKRTGGKLFNPAMEKMGAVVDNLKNGGVMETNQAVDVANNAGPDVTTSAYGRVVTKRGLTMISPGEIIIPASFDKREQAKMLAAEKRDRSRIMNAIGLNAKGTVDTDQMKKDLHKIYQENIGSGAKNTASGIMGAGAGLLLGVNPLLGAAAGAGLSILKNSETLKTMVFGKEGADGEREGGLVPKKFADFFKKALPDMGDFGLAGGILGLITPFGPLAGAAVGAGIGMLKNSDGFKKFIFGDAETGEGGFISKETKEKVQKFMKKAAPAAGIGAIAGIFAGPFGLIGNAVLGAGVGMLTTTTKFHDFLFGKTDEDGKRSGGLLGALNTGIIEPAKEKITEFLVDFKDFAREHVIKPLKDFWAPFKQDIKNVITGVGDKVKDFLNDTFEKHLGIPIHDFLQEKLFKPLTNTFFKILKAPFTLMKGALAAPAKLLGFIGNNRRAKQIAKGQAYDMSASERLAWREQHGKRMKWAGDRTLEEDQMLANMDATQLEQLRTNSAAGLESLEKLQRKKGEARDAVGKEFSKFFNEKVDGKNRYSRVNYSNVKKIVKELEEKGDPSLVEPAINSLKGLTDEEKTKLIENIKSKMEDLASATDIYEKAKTGSKATDAVLEKILGRKIKTREDRRQILRIAETELKARKAAEGKDGENKPGEPDSTVDFSKELKEKLEAKTTQMIDLLERSAKALEKLSGNDESKEEIYDRSARLKGWNRKFKINKKLGKRLKSGVVDPDEFEDLMEDHDSAYGVKDDEGSEPIDVNAYGSTYVKKHGLTMVSPGELIIGGTGRKHRKKYSGLIDLNAEGDVHEDSKEAVDARKKAEEEASDEKTANQAERESAGWLKKLHDKFFGDDKKKKKDKQGTGILSKIGTGIGTIFSWFTGGSGILGKIGLGAAALGGASLFGYATDWFKDKILPKLKEVLFGDPNDPTDGIWGKFTTNTKIGQALNKLVGDIKDNGGIGGWMANVAIPKVIDKLVVGWGYAMENIVAPLTAAIIKNLPKLLVSTVKALISGLGAAIFNKEIERDEASGELVYDTSDLAKTHTSSNSRTNSYVSKDVQSALGTTVKSSGSSDSATWDFSSYNNSSMDSNNVAADQTYDVEGNHLNKTGEEVLYEDRSNLSEFLFGKKLSNDIYYDENGNIGLNHYYNNNTTDSLSSKVTKATGRSFLQGVLGRGKSLISNLGNVSAKGVGKGWVKAGTTGAKATAKGAGKLFGGAHDLGSKIFGKLFNTGQADELASQLVKDSGLKGKEALALYGDISSEITKNGVDGVQSVFTKYGTSDEALTKAINLEDAIKNAAETGTKKGKLATLLDTAKEKFGSTKLGSIFNRKNQTSEFADAVAAATGAKGKKASKLSKKIQKNIKWNGTQGIDDALDLASKKTGKKVTSEMLDDVLEKGVKLTDTVTKAPTLRSAAKSKVVGVLDKATDIAKNSKAGKAVTGAANAVKEAATSSKAGKTVAKAVDTVKDVGTKVASGAKGLLDDILKKITSFFDEIATNSKILGFLKKAAKAGTSDNVIIKAVRELGEKIGKSAIAKAAKGALQKIAAAVAKYIPYINIAFYVADFISGYNNAYTILGVAKGDTYKVNFGQKCLCGLLNLITANLTLGLVPNELIVDIIVDIMFPIFGLDAKELKAARENADNVLDEWNKAHPEETYSNLEDFNKKDSLWNKMKKGTKKAWEWTKDKASKAGTAIKDTVSKVGDKAKEIGSNIVDGAKDALNKGKELVSGAFDKAKNATSKVKEGIKSIASTAKEEGIGAAAKEVADKAKDVAKETISKAKDALASVGDSVKDGFSKAKDWIGGLFGKGRNIGGSGSHAYQSDSMIANMRYAGSTIKDAGCAPVLATNLINSVRPGSMSVMEAAKFAEANNFTAKGGTDSKYFNKFLAGHGINTVETKSKDAIVAALRKGNQVIMLGQDSSDGPGTPFGRNPHFITVKGMRGGQFVVEDPSFQESSVVYNKDKVLNSMKQSIITSTSMIKPTKNNKRGRGRLFGGAAHLNNTVVMSDASGGTTTDTTATDETATTETTEETSTATNLLTALGELGTNVLKAMFGDAYEVMFGDGETSSTGTTSSTGSTVASVAGINLKGNDNAQKIWNYLREKGYSKAGAAGLMGNLYAESGFNPNNIENQYEGMYGDDATYTKKIDEKSYGKDAFSKDAAGYGLAQWTYHTRKAGLYDTTVGQGLSIADLAGQLAYLDKELQGYSALYKTLKNTTSIDTASDQVLTDFERPANLNYDTRRAYSKSVYDQYANATSGASTGTATAALNRPRNYVAQQAYGRNMVGGAGREGVDYATFLQTIVSILLEISSNTAILNKILELLAKQFDLQIDKAEVQAAAQATSKEQTKAMLDRLVQESGSNSNLTKMMNSHGTDYIFAAMSELARE